MSLCIQRHTFFQSWQCRQPPPRFWPTLRRYRQNLRRWTCLVCELYSELDLIHSVWIFHSIFWLYSMESLYYWCNSHTGPKPHHLVHFAPGRTITANWSEQIIDPTATGDSPTVGEQVTAVIASIAQKAPKNKKRRLDRQAGIIDQVEGKAVRSEEEGHQPWPFPITIQTSP